jgi:hypothetical protein
MILKQAKEYFDLGVITGFSAVRDPLASAQWLLVIEGKEGRSWTLQTALKAEKSYASLDTLMGEVENIAGRVSAFSITV